MYSSVFLGARLRSGNTSKVLILSHPSTPIEPFDLKNAVAFSDSFSLG
jgi:hypothetical protein